MFRNILQFFKIEWNKFIYINISLLLFLATVHYGIALATKDALAKILTKMR